MRSRFPRPCRRGRAELGTSQQSLERRSRAWNVARFSRVGMFLARRDVSRASGCPRRVMRENDRSRSAVKTGEVGSVLPHLSAALTFSPAGGGTDPSVTAAGGGATSPFRGGQGASRHRRRGGLWPPPKTAFLEKRADEQCSSLRLLRSAVGGGNTSPCRGGQGHPIVGAAFGRLLLPPIYQATAGRPYDPSGPLPRRRGGLWPPVELPPAGGSSREAGDEGE